MNRSQYKRVGDHFEWIKDEILGEPELTGEFAGSPAWGFAGEIEWSYSYEADAIACLWEAAAGDDDDESDATAELGVAIGVAIGVAVLLGLAALGCVCYRRRKASNPVQTATVVKQSPPA